MEAKTTQMNLHEKKLSRAMWQDEMKALFVDLQMSNF